MSGVQGRPGCGCLCVVHTLSASQRRRTAGASDLGPRPSAGNLIKHANAHTALPPAQRSGLSHPTAVCSPPPLAHRAADKHPAPAAARLQNTLVHLARRTGRGTAPQDCCGANSSGVLRAPRPCSPSSRLGGVGPASAACLACRDVRVNAREEVGLVAPQRQLMVAQVHPGCVQWWECGLREAGSWDPGGEAGAGHGRGLGHPCCRAKQKGAGIGQQAGGCPSSPSPRAGPSTPIPPPCAASCSPCPPSHLSWSLVSFLRLPLADRAAQSRSA